jgi:hypothetical protein
MDYLVSQSYIPTCVSTEITLLVNTHVTVTPKRRGSYQSYPDVARGMIRFDLPAPASTTDKDGHGNEAVETGLREARPCRTGSGL